MPTYVDQAFAFAHGRIGTLQQDLLTRSDVDRLLGTHNLQEAERALTELKLTSHINQGMNQSDEILYGTAMWVQYEVAHMAPEDKQDIFEILWLEGDAPLLAYLLKKKLGFTSTISQEPKSVMTAFPANELRILVETEHNLHVPESLVFFVKETLTKKDMTAATIDTAVAQWVADRQLKLAKESKSAGIRRYVAHHIDMQNIRTALRLQNEELTFRKQQLLKGGTIPPADLVGTPKQIAVAIRQSDLGFPLATAIEKSTEDINALERAFTDVLAEDIAVLWNIPLSVEPLFAFAALTLSQLSLLRVLLIGKRSGLSPQEIKQILPPFIPASHYVLS